jgi:hypothetical protein
MQHTTLSGRKSAQSTGEPISLDYFQFLVDGYKTKHPAEQQSVFIPKVPILKTLDQFPNISGLRFMYGLKESADPSSRTIILMACNDTSTDKEVLNLIFAPNGYLTNEGDCISIDQCWDLLARYVNRMSELTDYQGLYNSQFAECISMFGAGRPDEAMIVFKDKLDELMARYLFAN